mmetsp:Transcript_47544/g.152763  ORF Transcript_47544/g.152763 Transcript_47544/m.152763 type:complete len:280 (+) Transcript_47544:667-1506(+)
MPDGRSSSDRSNARSIEPPLEEPARDDSGVFIGPKAGLRSAIRVGSLGAGAGVSGGEDIGLSLGVAGIAGSPVFAATLGVASGEALGCGAKRADRGVEEPQLPPPRPVTAESLNADGAEGAEGAQGTVCAEGTEATGAGTAGAERCNRGTFGASPSLRDGSGNDLSSFSTATEATVGVFGRSGGGGRQCGAAKGCSRTLASDRRFSGSRTSSRRITSAAGAGTQSGRAKSTLDILATQSAWLLEANGGRPTSISKSSTPMAQMSTPKPCGSSWIISGER